MKIKRKKKPFAQLKIDIEDIYGQPGLIIFETVKHRNPYLILLEVFPGLDNGYSDYFKKQLYNQYKTRH